MQKSRYSVCHITIMQQNGILSKGKLQFERFMSETDKNLVKMEIDLAWATKAKQNPADLFKLYPGRYPCFHVKDYDLH